MIFRMFSYLAALLFAVFFINSGWPSAVQAKIIADCSFGEMKSWERIDNKSSVIKLSGQLPLTRNLSHSCIVKTDNQDNLLTLGAKRSTESREGSIHLSVYERDESVLGHLDIPKSALGQDWSSLTLCPSRSADNVEKYFTFSGTPGMVFTVQLSQDQDVKLDVPRTFEINQRDPIYVFQFIPPEDISKTQLDVTVTSDSDVPAYLKVSRNCKDVKDNIRLVDYKGESIRLSFAKKGRITLSKVSVPPLNDSTSPWFIGIALKNTLGTSKTVKLTLKRSFDYSYLWPILFIVLVPFSCGVFVAVWALNCFKEPHVNPRANDTESQPIRRSKKGSDVSVWKAMPKMVCKYWFRGENKTFSYITAIVGWVLFVGALQFVFANWYLMILEGDRDSCYYNDFCYRVLAFDIPFNLMISNLPYIIHAIILAVSVLYMEAELFVRCKNLVEATKTEGGENQNAEGEMQNIDKNLAEETKTEGGKRNAKGDTERRDTKGNEKSAEATQTERKKRKAGGVKNRAEAIQTEGEKRNAEGETERRNTEGNEKRAEATQTEGKKRKAGGDKNGAEAIETEGQPDPEGERQNAEGDKKTEDSTHGRLPNHVLTCPNIAPHLATMSVPHVPEQELKDEDYAEAHKRKFSFSIGYAFAWALFFEGMFSALYHLCPSMMTFQFDTAFMFVIAGLIVILLYNGIKLEECPNEGEPKGCVGAANFFLFFIVPLYFFNYFGSLYHSQSGLIPPVKILFFICLLIWYIIIAIWAGFKLRFIPKKKKERQGEGSPEQAGDQGEESVAYQLQDYGAGSSNDGSGRGEGQKDKNKPKEWCTHDCCKCFFFFLSLAAPIILLTLWLGDNFSEAFLITSIIESGIVLFWKATKKIKRCYKSNGNMTPAEKCLMFFQTIFIVATAVIMGFAVWLFMCKPSTNKTKAPEKSRDLNHECVAIGGFFDNHDLWHLLSSFALLMGAYLVMFVSYEPPINLARESDEQEPQSTGNEEPNKQNKERVAQTQGELTPLIETVNTQYESFNVERNFVF